MAAPVIGRPAFPTATATIDWSHPLAQRLVFYAMPGTGLPELVRGYLPTYTATGIVGTRFGPAVAYTGATSQLTYGTGPVMGGASDWSAICALRVNATSAATLLAKRNAYSANGEEFRMGLYGSGIVVSNGGNFTTLAGTVTANSQAVVGVTADASTVTSFVNGNRSNSATVNRRSSGTAGANTICVGRLATEGNDGLGDAANGAIAVVAAWNRAITPAEMAQISADPYCILRF